MLTYITKCYRPVIDAASKAKLDMEDIFEKMGGVNLTYPRRVIRYTIPRFFGTLIYTIHGLKKIKRGDILLTNYPFKKYYEFVCRVAHSKGAKIITHVHDLGSFRRMKLTPEKEIRRLSLSDAIVVQTPAMKKWLQDRGYNNPIVVRYAFDYLGNETPKNNTGSKRIRVTFAGNVSYDRNPYLYELAEKNPELDFELYGNYFSHKHAHPNMHYHGFIPAEKLIEEVEADFGLVWYGKSLTDSIGRIGPYIQYASPHKLSLNMRCGIPVIIANNSGQAEFVRENNIGITVPNLLNLTAKLQSFSEGERKAMKESALAMGKEMSEGLFTKRATDEALRLIGC